MSDLISREALINEFKNPDLFNVTEKHLSNIGNAPAVDAVEVVRCKDCLKRNTSMCHAGHEQADTDYCSHGERREGEGSE